MTQRRPPRRTAYLVAFLLGLAGACREISEEASLDVAGGAGADAGPTEVIGPTEPIDASVSNDVVPTAPSDAGPNEIIDAGPSAVVGAPIAFADAGPPRDRHRAGGDCDHERPPGFPVPLCSEEHPDAGPCLSVPGECGSDAECTAGENGRCYYRRCTYDDCFSDSDCTGGGLCICAADNDPLGNRCLPAGNCRTDADCTLAGSYCYPSIARACYFSGDDIVGYYCSTPVDECRTDHDCNYYGQCLYDTSRGHWICYDRSCPG
jgi:hypothetical protein